MAAAATTTAETTTTTTTPKLVKLLAHAKRASARVSNKIPTPVGWWSQFARDSISTAAVNLTLVNEGDGFCREDASKGENFGDVTRKR